MNKDHEELIDKIADKIGNLLNIGFWIMLGFVSGIFYTRIAFGV